MAKQFNDPTILAGVPDAADGIPFFNVTTGKVSYITLANLQAISGWSGGGGGDVTAPTVVSMTVENANPEQIVVVFSEAVTGVVVGDYSFKKNGSAWSDSSVSGSGTTWTFTMATEAGNDDVLLASYSGTGTIDGSSNALVAFTDEAVTNNVAAADFPHISNFTAANGTLLSAYTPDTGNAWSLGVDSIWEIQSNRLLPKLPFPGGDLPECSISGMPQDYTFRSTFKFDDTSTTGVVYLRQGTSKGVQFNFIHAGVGVYDVADGDTLIDTDTWTTSFADHLYEIVISGTSASLYRDTVLVGTYPFIAGNNGTGIKLLQAASATPTWSFDSVKAEAS